MEEKKVYTYKYPRPAVATDCVIFGFDGVKLKVLLIERGIPPFKGMLAFPGGFLREDETAEECALRELKEETGLEGFLRENETVEECELREPKEETKSKAPIEQFHCFSDPNRDPRRRVISIAFLALVKTAEVKGGDDAASAAWFPIDEVPQLAFDHDMILREAIKRLRERIHFEPVGFELLPEKFTLRQLQNLYEAILDVRFDRRNFAKKMLHFDLIRQLDETTWPTPKREANLYSFNREKYNELKERKGFRLEF